MATSIPGTQHDHNSVIFVKISSKNHPISQMFVHDFLLQTFLFTCGTVTKKEKTHTQNNETNKATIDESTEHD